MGLHGMRFQEASIRKGKAMPIRKQDTGSTDEWKIVQGKIIYEVPEARLNGMIERVTNRIANIDAQKANLAQQDKNLDAQKVDLQTRLSQLSSLKSQLP